MSIHMIVDVKALSSLLFLSIAAVFACIHPRNIIDAVKVFFVDDTENYQRRYIVIKRVLTVFGGAALLIRHSAPN